MGGLRLRIPVLEDFAIRAQKAFSYAHRPLTGAEKKLCLSIFGDSLNVDFVDIVLTDVGVKGRPYTLGNTIRIPRGSDFDAATLVHEMTHVWQYQTQGTRYISDSVIHQLTSDAYAVTFVPGKAFRDYEAEQQAMIVEGYYEGADGWNTDPDVLRMLNEVRSARPLSPGQIEKETWYGPGGPPANTDVERVPHSGQTVPLFRIEF